MNKLYQIKYNTNNLVFIELEKKYYITLNVFIFKHKKIADTVKGKMLEFKKF